MQRKTRRLWVYGIVLLLMGIGLTILLRAFNNNIVFFVSPTEYIEGTVDKKSVLRLGGLVQKGSIKKVGDGLTTQFKIHDFTHAITVEYRGIPPNLFRSEKGIVARGKMQETGIFQAQELLAKHDENYQPPKIKKILEAQEAAEAGARTAE